MASVMALGLAALPGMNSYADTYVVIGNAFPDETFAQYVHEKFDTDTDGALNDEERDAVTVIDVGSNGISSLAGIENFSNLQNLYCGSNSLKSLDVSKNTNLKKLYCNGNFLSSLDVSKNPDLITLECYNNELNSLDVSKNTKLEKLDCYGNKFKSLDVTKNTALVYLDVCSKYMEKVDISGVLYLNETVKMGATNFTNSELYGPYYDFKNTVGTTDVFLSVGAKTKVEPIGYYIPGICPDSNFASKVQDICDDDNNDWLSDSEIKAHKSLTVSNQNINSLEGIEYLTELTTLDCSDNKLNSLDLSKNVKLEKLDCGYNELASIDLSANTKLNYLNCAKNELTSLDLSKNQDLTLVMAYGNRFKTLDVSGRSNLVYLDVPSTYLKGLNIDGCDKLWKAYNDGTTKNYENAAFGKYTNYEYKNGSETYFLSIPQDIEFGVVINSRNFPDDNFRASVVKFDTNSTGVLSSAEISKVKKMDISSKSIVNLKGIEFFTDLEELECYRNFVEKADFSSNTKLKEIDLTDNELTSLNVSKCTELTSLVCDINHLTKLDVGNLKKLTTLYCQENKLTGLDVSKNTGLVTLNCSKNDIASLDVSQNTKLMRLCVYNSKLKTLDIYKCPGIVKAYKQGEKKEVSGHLHYIVDVNNYFDFDKTLKVNDTAPTPTPTAKPTAKPDQNIDIKLDKSTLTVKCGNSSSLKATVVNGANVKVTWKSSNEKIATVDANGKIKTKMAGTVKITATAAGKSAECTLTVLYKDVTSTKDFWYKPTNYLTAKDVVKGYDKQTKFKPANECTRAQMLTFMWRLQGEPEPKAKTCKFPDVKKSNYFFKPVIWAVEQGITTGYKDGTFKPQNVCTRAQTVTFLWRMAEQPEPSTNKCKFKDVKAKDYFYQPVIWASEKKIVEGYKDGTFKPQGKCLRRQMVTFLYKYDKFVNGKG